MHGSYNVKFPSDDPGFWKTTVIDVSRTCKSHLCFLPTTQLVILLNTEKRKKENISFLWISYLQVIADRRLH